MTAARLPQDPELVVYEWDVIEARVQHYTGAPPDLVRLKPGVRDELEAMRANHPLTKLAVLSTRPQWVVEAAAKAAGLEKTFARILGTGGSKIAEKPSPEGLETIAKALSADPRRSVMIGDTALDVAAGKAAGMCTVALRDGNGTRRALDEAQPDYLLDDLGGFGVAVLPSAKGLPEKLNLRALP